MRLLKQHKYTLVSSYGPISEQRRQEENLRKRAEPRGYLIEDLVVWRSQAAFLRRLLDEHVHGWAPGHLRFIGHLLHCQFSSVGKGLSWVPVYYRLIEEVSPTGSSAAVTRPLIEAGIIEYVEHSRFERKSREYRVVREVVDLFLEAAPRTAAAAAKACGWWLVKNRKTTKPYGRTSEYNDQKNYHPEVVRRGLKAVERGLFYAPAVEAHLVDLKARAEEAAYVWEAAGRPGRKHPDPRLKDICEVYERAWGRYQSDRRSYDIILHQRLEATDRPGVYSYLAAYEPQSTGRIGFIGGGLQSATRRMKQAAYGWLPGVFNYDLRSAHPNFLIELLDEAGLDSSWLRDYVADSGAKHRYAKEVGIDVRVWKQILNGHLNGANIPTSLDENLVNGEVANLIRKNVPPHEQYRVLRTLRQALSGLTPQLHAWHSYLVTEYADQRGKNSRRGRLIHNDAGMPFYLEEAESDFERKARLAAHMLQGREAAFVHTLASLGEDFGYEVIAHEHDGLVTLGPIPDAAVARTQEITGIGRVSLEEKDFCKPEEREALIKVCERHGVTLPSVSTMNACSVAPYRRAA